MTTIAPVPPTTSPPLTPADVARLSDEHGKLYELVDGRLVEKPMGKQSLWVASRINHLLQTVYPPSKAFVFLEPPTYCFPGRRHGRRPDVAMVWAERAGSTPDDEELQIAPDLVVEVVSPSNTFLDQFERVEEYLKAGVPLVWLVEPVYRSVHVYRKDGSVSLLHETDVVKDEPLLPGLVLPVAEFFAGVPKRTPEPQS